MDNLSIENDPYLNIGDEIISQQYSPIKYNFESSYILLELGILHPTQGMNREEKKLTKNDVLCMKNI